ncbi:unnamed protein product [Mucor hiemalis]
MNNIIENLVNKGQGTVRLDLDFQPGIALVTIDNPKRHNALSGKMMVEFYHTVTQLERNDKDIVAVIVKGGGNPIKSFCAGLDLSFACEHVKSPEDTLAMNRLMHDAITRFSQLPLITLAVVTGGAIGGGSELVTGFDFVCMSEESGFIHFVQTRMGVSSPWGGMSRLIEIVGRKKALKWMAGGFRITAKEGLEAGIVDITVEKDADCLDTAVAFLQPFLVDSRTERNVSSNAVRGMKMLSNKKNSSWEYDSKIFGSVVFSKL